MLVSELSPDDADWAADLMAERRREYERYSPVFWRPAAQARARHVRFLRRQIADPGTVALRSPRAFLIAQLRPAEAFVDDFAVDRTGTWADDGAELLLATWSRVRTTGVSALRVVTARADGPKSALLNGLHLELVEQWWVHELPAAPSKAAGSNLASGASLPSTEAPASGDDPAAGAESRGGPRLTRSGRLPGPARPLQTRPFEPPQRIEGPGFSGLFGSAPPVYDPGGPVLLADRVAANADPAALDTEAIRLGAALLVVPAAPGSARARELAQERLARGLRLVPRAAVGDRIARHEADLKNGAAECGLLRPE